MMYCYGVTMKIVLMKCTYLPTYITGVEMRYGKSHELNADGGLKEELSKNNLKIKLNKKLMMTLNQKRTLSVDGNLILMEVSYLWVVWLHLGWVLF